MGEEKSYFKLINKNKSMGWHLLKAIFLSGIFLSGTSAMAFDVAPSYVGGTPQSLAVCAGSGATDITSLLTINPLLPGQTETWSVHMPAVHGTLSGFNASAVTTGAALTPSGLSYSPPSGYAGLDSFTITVSDGVDSALTTIIVTINPIPALMSTLSPASICNGTTFNYSAAANVPGASLNWYRPFVGGISNPAASGSGNISEMLNNITYYNVPVTYIYTVSANGCSSTESVMVTIYPTPRLSGSLTDTICSGELFNYTVSSPTTGTTISWSRAAVTGISPATASGTGNISETLSNSTGAPLNTIYAFHLSANGCFAQRNLTVTVAPPMPGIGITTYSPLSVCSGTAHQNFGASVAPAAGVSYVWSASNAVIDAQGNTGQYVLVNFNTPGDAVITLSATVPGTTCMSQSSVDVTVGTGVSSASSILYTGTQFVYLDNTSDSYQWGYDNKLSLDSTLIPGATFQSYPDTNPDVMDNYYWVITTKGGCMQKTYYNGPLAVNSIQQNIESIKLHPNPASSILNVDINTKQGSAVTVILADVLGRTLISQTGSQHTIQFDIASMPAGCYLVTAYQDGVKMTTSRFIKN